MDKELLRLNCGRYPGLDPDLDIFEGVCCLNCVIEAIQYILLLNGKIVDKFFRIF